MTDGKVTSRTATWADKYTLLLESTCCSYQMKTTNTFTFSRDSEPDMHGLCQPRTPTLTFIFPSDVGVTATQGLSFRTSHRDDVMAAVSMALLSCWRPCFSDHEAHFSVLARCSSSVRPSGFEPDNQQIVT